MNPLIVIPTMYQGEHWKRCLASLQYIPFDFSLRIIAGETFNKAVNIGFKDATSEKRDLLIINDDCEWDFTAWKDWPDPMNAGDIIGWTLMNEDGTIQEAGCTLEANKAEKIINTIPRNWDGYLPGKRARPIPHVSYAFVYIKYKVIKALNRMLSYGHPSGYGDDLAYNLRAAKAGFRIVAISEEVIHLGGATTRELGHTTDIKGILETIYEEFYT